MSREVLRVGRRSRAHYVPWFDHNFFRAKSRLMRIRTEIIKLAGYGRETKRPVIEYGQRADRSAFEFGL